MSATETATQTVDATERTELILPAKAEAALTVAGMEESGAMCLRRAFSPHFAAFDQLAVRAKEIRFDEPNAARALRLQVKAVRTGAERTRKLLKEDSLRRGRAIDGIHAVLEYAIAPVEEAMDAIEKAEERARQVRIENLRTARMDELRAYCKPEFYDLGNMPEEAYAALLDSMKAANQLKDEAAAKEQADKVERDRVAAEEKAKRDKEGETERERMRVENERLAQVAADEKAKREQQEATAKAEREAAEESARVAKAEADRLANSEREKREAAERELARIAKEAADKAAADAAAIKKAQAAPDREKLAVLAAGIRAMPLPTLATPAGVELVARIAEQRAKFAAWVESEAAKV
jgi:colicin import membrane protein